MNQEATTEKWKSKPEDAEVIDELFWIRKQRWGTFVSIDENDNPLVTADSCDFCEQSTRWYMKAKQEGFPEASTYEGEVGGKL